MRIPLKLLAKRDKLLKAIVIDGPARELQQSISIHQPPIYVGERGVRGHTQIASDELAQAMQIDMMVYPTGVSGRHDSYPILIGLREVGRIAAKFAWEAGRENFIDRTAQHFAIVLGKEDHHRRPPLMIGGTLRIKTKHVGPVAE